MKNHLNIDIFIYYLRYKILYSAKPFSLSIIFHKISEYIKDYDGSKYLTLIPANEKYTNKVKTRKEIWVKIRYLKVKTNESHDYDNKYLRIGINFDIFYL